MPWFITYLLTIVAANAAIDSFGLVPVGFGLVAPAGVYFAGFAFILRDFVHERFGWRGASLAIVIGAILSWFISPAFAIASASAFLFSESLDMLVYTPLRHKRWRLAIILSNAVGVITDSIIFLWIAFGSIDFLLGQIVGKSWTTLIVVLAISVIGTTRSQQSIATSG